MDLQGVGKENDIYKNRFSNVENKTREVTWEVLGKEFLQKYVSTQDCVVDLGAGDGNFITNIKARRKIAVDLSPHVNELAKFGIEVIQASATEFGGQINEKVNVIFMSNFLEHLPNKRLVLDVFEHCRSVLDQNGLMIILQPNIRYVGVAYWDYIDHHIALTEHCLTEALDVTGFNTIEIAPRFLPYTAKSMLGRICGPARMKSFVSFYLKNKWLWRFFGKQTFIVARPKLKLN